MSHVLKNQSAGFSRRSFFARTSLVGSALLLPRLGFSGDNEGGESDHDGDDKVGLSKGDKDIITAAAIAEALAVTTYSNIIGLAPFFGGLASDDQKYLAAALQEEMSHYALLTSLTEKPSPFTAFYYPSGMFHDAQTTLNILVTLEDAFIAAYLVGVRNFSSSKLRVSAARIMGIESDHRSLARVIASDLGLPTVTGAEGVAESISPPNNNGYERTLKWTKIEQAVAALTPFADATAAAKAGFDTGTSYAFQPFTPTLPNPLGDFISFGG